MGFLEFIFYFFLTLFLLGWLARTFGPYLLRGVMRRAVKRMEQQLRNQQAAYSSGTYGQDSREERAYRRDMGIRVPRNPEQAAKTKNTPSGNGNGRYASAQDVDFEEVPD